MFPARCGMHARMQMLHGMVVVVRYLHLYRCWLTVPLLDGSVTVDAASRDHTESHTVNVTVDAASRDHTESHTVNVTVDAASRDRAEFHRRTFRCVTVASFSSVERHTGGAVLAVCLAAAAVTTPIKSL